jgi:alpha-glucosidase
MAQAAWWQGAVIYQVPSLHVPGGTETALAEIDRAASRGVDAVWVGGESSPTDSRFAAVLSYAHQRGLKVVANQASSHTSDGHPWFVESRRDRINPRSHWYVWADAAPNGGPPNNWLSDHGGPAWTWEPQRRQFYLHHFRPDQPALNLGRPEVAAAILSETESWLERRVDCIHFEGIDFLFHDRPLRDNPRAGAVSLRGSPHHLRSMLQPEVMPWLGRLRDLFNEFPGRCALGEVSAHPGGLDRARMYTTGRQRLHMAYTPQPLPQRFDWASMQHLVHEMAAAGDDGWVCRCVTPGSWGGDRVSQRLRMAFLLTLRGSLSFGRGVGTASDLRRFLTWRRQHPAILRGVLRALYLPEPLVGFVREHAGERMLAVFNPSAAAVEADLADFAAVRPCSHSGFTVELGDRVARLPAWGALFAAIVPAQEWQEEAALAFA